MAKLARIVVAGMPHHVTHRGNRKCVLYWDEADRRTYLRILLDQIIKTGLRIWAYALMTNHVHFVAVPKAEESLGVFFRNVDGTYADYFNTRYDQVGHLWGERFKSSVLDERHLWNAVRCVERNPVRAGLVDRADDYPWSSAAAHCGLREDPLLANDLPLLGQIPDWSGWLSGDLPLENMELLRARTHSGRPCGDDAFLRRLSTQLGRDLLPKKRGTKPKPGEDDGSQAKLFDDFGG